MGLLSMLPLAFCGELHGVRLFNFSVDASELAAPCLPLKLYKGRALISLVDVHLRRMRPTGWPAFCGIRYRHIALRLLVKDAGYTGKGDKGVLFLRSFAENPVLVQTGRLLTDFRLERAQICDSPETTELRRNGTLLFRYGCDSKPAIDTAPSELQHMVAAIDRAWSPYGDALRLQRIERRAWPLERLEARCFWTSLFASARLEEVYRVPRIINYRWNAPEKVLPCVV